MFTVLLADYICFLFLLTACTVECKRTYDIEAETVRLYGEDLKSALRSFRKTPEYLKIVKDRMDQHNEEFEDVVTKVIIYYTDLLEKKAAHLVAPELVSKAEPDGDNFTFNEIVYRVKENYRKSVTTTDDPVKALDEYKNELNALTISEKEQCVDLGFEYAGRYIHTLIKSLEMPSDEFVQTNHFTLYQTEDTSKTTEHVLVHEVTHSPTNEGHYKPKPDDEEVTQEAPSKRLITAPLYRHSKTPKNKKTTKL